MTSLRDVATPAPDGAHFTLAVPAGWRQGRGAYGGLGIAAMIRAIDARAADESRKVRSVTAELPAPLEAGAAQIVVDVLRTGNAVTTARAAIEQGGEVRGHAVAVLAATRPGAGPTAWTELTAPVAKAWRELEPMPISPLMPEFAANFEYRPAEGIPMTGGAARCVGWVRPRDRVNDSRDAGYIAAMCDAWWPAALVRFDTMRPIATIAYTLDIVGNLDGLDPESPLLYRGVVPYCADGYFLETRELWGEDGRLVAINHQTFVVIK
jgi:hypothetical protein